MLNRRLVWQITNSAKGRDVLNGSFAGDFIPISFGLEILP